MVWLEKQLGAEQMEVIDKRGGKQASDWQVSGIVCLWEDIENKRYAIIVHTGQEDGYGSANLSVSTDIERILFVATVSSVIDILIGRDIHAKKVNARLAMKDQSWEL